MLALGLIQHIPDQLRTTKCVMEVIEPDIGRIFLPTEARLWYFIHDDFKHIQVEVRECSQLLLEQRIVNFTGLFRLQGTVIIQAPQKRFGDELLANLNYELLAIDVD